jgi:hypothetical protein
MLPKSDRLRRQASDKYEVSVRVLSMVYALRWRLMLLLAGLGALAGCAEMPGGTGYPPVQLDPRFAADRYLAPASASDALAQTHTAESTWNNMGNRTRPASPPPVVAASREEPVLHTSSVQMSAPQQPDGPPVSATGASTRRSLYDKQPWEVELDKIVRGICRGC